MARFFLFALVSMGSLFLMAIVPIRFARPLAEIFQPWMAESVSLPVLIVVLCGLIVAAGLKVSRRIEEVLGDLSEAGNRALGGAVGLAIAILLVQFIL